MSPPQRLVSLLLLLLFCIVAPLGTSAQYSALPVSLCPAGFDCVGAELSPYLSESIDCSYAASGHAFAGFLCSTDSTPFDICPSGSYCPSPTQEVTCPKGSWCPMGSSKPTGCDGVSICGAGVWKQRALGLVIFVCCAIAVLIVLNSFAHYYIRQRIKASAKDANEAATLSPIPAAEAVATWSVSGKQERARSRSGVELQPAGEKASPAAAFPEAIHVRALGSARVAQQDNASVSVELNNVSVTIRTTAAAAQNSKETITTSAASVNPAPAAEATSGSFRTLIHPLSFRLTSGRLTAIMGPSGAGKSTLLSALLGQVALDSTGSIRVNDRYSMSDVLAMRVCAFVPQADVMHGQLTVKENVTHAARMRLPGEMSDEEKLRRVDAALAQLNIQHIAESVVGDDNNRGISGGQRKRCSIAMEIVANPLILMLDEPTTGLDATAALQVCAGLKTISNSGKLVCCVIHQPRWDIFRQFDDVLLLSKGGHLVYAGPAAHIQAFFADLGYLPPDKCNPADFIADVVSDEDFVRTWISQGPEGFRLRREQLIQQQEASARAANLGLGIASPESPQGRGVASLNLPRSSSSELRLGSPTLSPASPGELAGLVASSASGGNTVITAVKPPSFAWQLLILMRRQLLLDFRNPSRTVYDTIIQIIPPLALCIGGALNDDTYSAPLPQLVADTCIGMVRDRCQNELVVQKSLRGSSFFLVLVIGVCAAIWSTSVFGRDSAVARRERLTGLSNPAYFLSTATYDVLHQVRMACIFVAVYYTMDSPIGGFGWWMTTITLMFWAAAGQAYTVAMLVPYKRGSTAIAIVVAVCTAVTSGLTPTLNVELTWGPLPFFWYISYCRWGAEAIVDISHRGQETDGRMNHAITAVGYNPANVNIDLAMLAMLGIAWRLVAFTILILKARQESNKAKGNAAK